MKLGPIQLLAAAMVFAAVQTSNVFAACTVNDATWDSSSGGCKDLGTGGLVWSIDSVKVSGSNNSYPGAVNYCAGLVEGGFDDWRLPTKTEMETAASRDAAGHLDYAYGADNLRWSSTPKGKNIWAVRIGNGTSQAVSKTSSLFEFCVRTP